MFVAFDGIDGCGKTRQADLFKDYCEKSGLTVTINRDPGGTPAGTKIRQILLDKSTPLTPEGQTMLFMAARAELCHLIQEQEKQHEVVISDRWVLSTLAYQCHLQSVDRQFVLDLYRTVIRRSPDVYVVIDIDPG
jgi:dTMP kinase